MTDQPADPVHRLPLPVLVTLLGVAAALAPLGEIHAQVCLGSPNGEGQYSITGDASMSGGNNDFGVGVEANFPGPLGARAGVSLAERTEDDRVTRFDGRLSYDIRSGGGLSICPVVGADYSRETEEAGGVESTTTLIRIPVGLSMGGRLSAGEGMSLIPSARAGVAHRRLSFADQTETENSFFVVGGGTLALDDVHLRAEAGRDTADDDPFFRFQIGIRR